MSTGVRKPNLKLKQVATEPPAKRQATRAKTSKSILSSNTAANDEDMDVIEPADSPNQ